MEIKQFEEDLKTRDGIPITSDAILFNDYELFFMSGKKSVMFNSFDEILKYKLNGKTLKQLIQEMETTFLSESGGRGLSLIHI